MFVLQSSNLVSMLHDTTMWHCENFCVIFTYVWEEIAFFLKGSVKFREIRAIEDFM